MVAAFQRVSGDLDFPAGSENLSETNCAAICSKNLCWICSRGVFAITNRRAGGEWGWGGLGGCLDEDRGCCVVVFMAS